MLVLSLFPGLDVLGFGFERQGFCVVQSGDVIWGRDVRQLRPPPGRFDGVIGGPPCQAFSGLANLVRAKGQEPRFGNLIPEFERVVHEAQPAWFLMENVRNAPSPVVEGYSVSTFLLDLSHLDAGEGTGHRQRRTRRFWFGVRHHEAPDLRRWINFALFVLPDRVTAVVGNNDGHDDALNHYREKAVTTDQGRAVPVKLGGSGRVKPHYREEAVTGRHTSQALEDSRRKPMPQIMRTVAEMLDLQGLPKDFLDHMPLRQEAIRKLVGNAVPLPMAEALAFAVIQALRSLGLWSHG